MLHSTLVTPYLHYGVSSLSDCSVLATGIVDFRAIQMGLHAPHGVVLIPPATEMAIDPKILLSADISPETHSSPYVARGNN